MKTKIFWCVSLLLIILGILIFKLSIHINNNNNFSFKYDETFLVPVHIGTKKFLFLLDTGSTNTLIDTQLAKQFSTPLEGKDNKVEYVDAVNSMVEDVLIKPINLKIGNNSILPSTLISHDFIDIRKASGDNIQGIIGLDIIRRFIWTIDLKKHQITMSDNIKYVDNQQCTKMQDDGYSLFISSIHDAKNEKANIDFILDTGLTGSKIETGLANYLRSKKSVVENNLIKENPITMTTIKSTVFINDMASYINNIYFPIISNKNISNKLEPIILSDVDVIKNSHNLLGQNFLEQFSKVIINPYEMTFCFIKNPEVKVLKTIRQIYISKENNNNKFIIDQNNNQYLNKFSLKNKDEIISINGKKYSVADIEQVRRLLRYEHNLILEIKRNNNLIKVKLD